MKPKHFYIAIMAAVIIWVANYTYFEAAQLEKPVFLDHYYEAYFGEEEQLTFFYITNKNDQSSISYIELMQEDSQNRVDVEIVGEQTVEEKYTHYDLKSVVVRILDHSENITTGSLQFNNITVQFNNGRSQTVPIGAIKIIPSTLDKVFEFKSGGSNSFRESLEMMAIEDVRIEQISSSFHELDKASEIKVNHIKGSGKVTHSESSDDILSTMKTSWNQVPGKQLSNISFPLQLKKYDRLGLYVQFREKQKASLDYAISINGRTESGKSVHSQMRIQMRPQLSQKEIQSIIIEKSGNQSKKN